MVIATLNMIRIDRRLRESLQLQLYRQIRQAIISGSLTAGVRLPSTRELVGQLGLARNTIVYAFDRLVSEGYLEGRRGSGIYVAELPQLRAKSTVARSANTALSTSAVSSRTKNPSRVNVSPEYPGGRV